MLKLTAHCPADQTQGVIALLREEPHVRNVTHMQGVEVSSGGDVVMAESVTLMVIETWRRWRRAEI